jgi:hypothetical protein
MYLKSYYSTLGLCLVGSATYLFSEAALPSCLLDRADKLVGLDSFIPTILPPVRRNELYALTKPITYIWMSGTQNGTTQSSPPSTNVKKDDDTDTGDSQTEKLKAEEPPECGDDSEQFYCDDCGGGEWDSVSDALRCKGV